MRAYPRPIHAAAFGDDAAEDEAAKIGESLKLGALYHSVELTPMTWAEIYAATTGRGDLASPGPGDASWIKYRLNELGYLAGPLGGAKDAQARRALKRYSREVIGREEDDETKDGLEGSLATTAKARADLVETPAALNDRNRSTRLLLDHDFCVEEATKPDQPPRGSGEANKVDGHADMEALKLDRFEQPFKVKIFLVSKRDRSGFGAGVFAPEATGAVKVEWHAFDPPEDTSVVGAPFTSVTAELRTKVPAYLLAAQAKLAKGAVDDPLRAYDNCPAALGGIRPDDKDDMTPYFRPGGLPGVFADEVSGKKFLSVARTAGGSARLEALRGMTGAIFWGSYVAGDNWAVQARLSFEGIDGKEDLVTLHQKLAKHAKSFDKYEPGDSLTAQTGKMTLWRRHHVVAVVDWWSNKETKPIDWPVIVAAFKAAHIVLVPPSGPPRAVASLVDGVKRDAYTTEVVRVAKAAMRGFITPEGREAAIAWKHDAIIPLRFPTRDQRVGEDFMVYKFDVGAQQVIAHYSGATYQLHRLPGDFVRAWLPRDAGAGQIILRFDHLSPAKVEDHLNPADKKKLAQKKLAAELPFYKKDDRGDGGPSIGVSGGVAMIEHQHSKQFTASFLVAHEMGHNYYLTHASSVRDDHDAGDPNCAMFYPSETPEAFKKALWGREAGAGKPVPLFCGKCILKLRGWKVRPADLPKTS